MERAFFSEIPSGPIILIGIGALSKRFRRNKVIKMPLSEKEVEHIAELAKIKISKDEKKVFTKQFNEILQFFQQLDEVDTSSIEPTFHVVDIRNIFREDKAEPTLSTEEALKNAPKKEKKFFKAPKLFD